MKSKFTIALAITMIALFSSSAMAVGSFEFMPFGDSFFPGAMSTNFDGSAVAGWGNNYWSPETDWVVVADGTVGKITGNGQAIIGTINNPADGLNWAAVYDVPSGVWTLMEYLPGGEGCSDWGTGYAGNFDGTMATGLAWVPNCRAEAFLWTQGVGTVGLGRVNEDSSTRGSGMSDDGSMVVGFSHHPTMGHRQLAIWTDDVVGPQVLGGDDTGEFLAVNSFGTAACGTANNEQVYWDDVNGLIPLGALPGELQGSLAIDISDDGKVVGQSGNAFFSVLTGTIWTVEDGLMPISEYFDTFGVPTPAGFHYSSCSGVSADGQTFVGAGVVEGGFLNSPWIVRLDDSVVGAYVGRFDVTVNNQSVDMSFQVNDEALINEFVMVAEYQGQEWTVPLTRQGSTFVGNDDSIELRQGGTAVYSLYLVEDGELLLMASRSVDLDVMPAVFTQLKGAYPNPFNPMTKIAFSMAEAGHVELSVYDTSGRRVARLASETYSAGDHTVTWEGRDDSGRAMASGTYFVQMKAGSVYQQQKVNLVK